METKTALNENALGLRFSGRAWTSDAWASDDDRTEKICALDSGCRFSKARDPFVTTFSKPFPPLD
jgi:hypothetical protein